MEGTAEPNGTPQVETRKADRWLAVGACFTGLGGLAVLTYWIYVQSGSHRHFLSLPGDLSMAALIFGFATLAFGFFAPSSADPSPPRVSQDQHGGAGSTNVQIGGDVRIDARDGRR